MAKAMVYIQSGGPTSVINTSLYGAITEAKKHPEISNIYGSLNGIEGLIDDKIIDIDIDDVEKFKSKLSEFEKIFGYHTACYEVTPSDGAKVVID